MNKTIKCLQINKGDTDLESRVDQINDLLTQYKPHVVVINELNSSSGDQITRNQFKDYHLETDNLDIVDRTSRTGVLIFKDLHYQRRRDLETTGISTIWLQFNYPGRKALLFQAMYRQFQRLGVPGSLTPSAQHRRWTLIIDKWEQAIKEEREIITMGDMNLNYLRWETPTHLKNSYDRMKDPMIKLLKEKILDKGFTILSNVPTKLNDNNQEKPSCLDLMITNRVEKITSYQAGITSFSDHTLQYLTRSTRGIQTSNKYARIRSYKNFSIQQYRDNIINHHYYIDVLYENDPEIISRKIQDIMKDSLEPMAPIRVIQISDKTSTRLSQTVRAAIAERDLAHATFKETNMVEDMRHYRRLRNATNRLIAKEKFKRKVKTFQGEDQNLSDKWKTMKRETGQANFASPQTITENGKQHTTHANMAAALNRQYTQTIRKLIGEMESNGVDPLEHYRKVVPQGLTKFTFKQINMSQLRTTLSRMRATGSMGEDDLSTKNIKQAQKELEPLLLKLINTTIKSTTYPEALKTTKIVPIPKPNKNKNNSDGWRPVNLVVALSKVIERVLLGQILDHLDNNKLVPAQHHGSIRGKSTQTLVNELHDLLVEDLKDDKEGALIVLDQSKAYECINHNILLDKMSILGFQQQAVAIMKSFLGNRKQIVQVQAHRSPKLDIGPQSVIQGSTLSCVLFLIYILDMPMIFHNTTHTPQEYRQCQQPNLKTYVDDSYVKTYKKDNMTIKETIQETMDTILSYTQANKLAVNPDKTLIMLQTKNQALKDSFSIILNGKEIKHQKEIKILGNLLSETLTWDAHVVKLLIPALKNRIRTLKLMTRYLDNGFKAMYTNAVFKSKMMFGLETWGGAKQSHISMIQSLQDKASLLALPQQYQKMSSSQRQQALGWLNVRKEILRATMSFTQKIINTGKPEELASQMPTNEKNLRISEHKKLGTRPRWLGASKVTRATYRTRAYMYNTLPKALTTQIETHKFKKRLREYLFNKR